MNWAAIAGLISGAIMRVKIPKNDVPSILAASITAFGTLIKYCLKKNTITMLPKIGGMMSGSNVSTQPMLANIENCGIIKLGYGIIIADSNNKKIIFLFLSRSFAKAKAARLDVNEPTMVTD